ncbi:uncharacterized protein LOC110010650 [Jatropha curcas]|uniref:uncharacterized protein LOC110010650 n=1 Tax=Jatropha curcas TaxID=180498 RepID=UPI0009D700D3|nr:uncharacterized protein LOC110010650 [Jatropha curcas]
MDKNPIGGEGLDYDLIIHYGGVKGQHGYFEESEFTLTCCNVDMMSIIRVDKALQRMGIEGVCRHWCLEPGKEFSESLKPLEKESDVYEMSLYSSNHEIVHVYVEHLRVAKIEEAININAPTSSIVIDEIVDETIDVTPKPSKPSTSNPIT